MAQNPWAVESIRAFYFLKCPECDFDTRKENSFENHATENHPLSFVLFDKKSVNENFESINIKKEPFSQFETQISHNDESSPTNNQFSPSCYINEDTSMMAQNPWAVESIQAFYFLKCLECDFHTREENSFENHATENHPLSFALFEKKYVEEDLDTIDIKEEPLSHSDTQISYDLEKSSTHNQFSQLFSHFDTQISHNDENLPTNNQFSPSCFINENTSMLVVQDLKKEPADVDENELRAYENDFNNSSEMENYSTEDFDTIDIKEESLSQYDDEKSSTHNQFEGQ